jgi:arylsulfatase A-like enzyme
VDTTVSANVLLITIDQWRGDCLSALGHPQLRTPTLDRLAASGVLFANHWANAAPCGPSRACLYTGTYLHHNRSLHNGTPLDARFTNVALLARQAGYDPVLFGYTDSSVDPRTVPADDPRLFTYEGVLPGFRAEVLDPWEQGSPAWGRWLAAQGVAVPANPHDLYKPIRDFPGAEAHGSTWAPARFSAEQSQTVFIVDEVIDYLKRNADEPFFVHASFIRPHPPRRNPLGYHDLYDADDVAPFVAAERREDESRLHPINQVVMNMPGIGAPDDERERRQLRATYYGAQGEVDDGLARLFDYLDFSGLTGSTLVVLTSDHGEMGCDHWLTEKLGYWDESYSVPLIVVDPDNAAAERRGSVVHAFTESVDVVPTICEWLDIEVPLQVDGWSLAPFVREGRTPEHWRTEAHFEWDFSTPDTGLAESYFGIPMSHCSLAVLRGASYKYVQFAAPVDVLPPLFFDLEADPDQLLNRFGRSDWAEAAFECAQALLQWRMRNDERILSQQVLSSDRGLVVARDLWR